LVFFVNDSMVTERSLAIMDAAGQRVATTTC
jgi:hypothetical protein